MTDNDAVNQLSDLVHRIVDGVNFMPPVTCHGCNRSVPITSVDFAYLRNAVKEANALVDRIDFLRSTKPPTPPPPPEAQPTVVNRLKDLPVIPGCVLDPAIYHSFSVRSHLEVFDGPILTELELRLETYLEKWCTQTANGYTSRSLITASDRSTITAYTRGEIDLYTAMTVDSGGVGMLVDRNHKRGVSIKLVALVNLPDSYLPAKGAMHDHGLKPR